MELREQQLGGGARRGASARAQEARATAVVGQRGLAGTLGFTEPGTRAPAGARVWEFGVEASPLDGARARGPRVVGAFSPPPGPITQAKLRRATAGSHRGYTSLARLPKPDEELATSSGFVQRQTRLPRSETD